MREVGVMLKITGSLDFLDRASRTGWTSPTAPRARMRQKRWIRLVAAGLACVLAAACTSPVRDEATPTSAASPSPTQRDYWPTAGWRTAAPDQQGMNPAVLDDLNTVVPNFYPQVRSVLVIRHGYLVYEGYWHGFTASDGHDSRSVTKSFVSALVGIALRDRHLESLDQTVEELLADHLPANAEPRLRQATVKQLLAMTSGLAGDDSSLGGDDKISDRMFRSRDWIRHILGRRLRSPTAYGRCWSPTASTPTVSRSTSPPERRAGSRRATMARRGASPFSTSCWLSWHGRHDALSRTHC